MFFGTQDGVNYDCSVEPFDCHIDPAKFGEALAERTGGTEFFEILCKAYAVKLKALEYSETVYRILREAGFPVLRTSDEFFAEVQDIQEFHKSGKTPLQCADYLTRSREEVDYQEGIITS